MTDEARLVDELMQLMLASSDIDCPFDAVPYAHLDEDNQLVGDLLRSSP